MFIMTKRVANATPLVKTAAKQVAAMGVDLKEHVTVEPGERPLLKLVGRQRLGAAMLDWEAQAACAGVDPESFTPETGGPIIAARALCRRCGVQGQCVVTELASAARPHSVRGGMDGAELGALKRALGFNRTTVSSRPTEVIERLAGTLQGIEVEEAALAAQALAAESLVVAPQIVVPEAA
jgi:hypothetical protein